jgi:hypothetical protein
MNALLPDLHARWSRTAGFPRYRNTVIFPKTMGTDGLVRVNTPDV